MSREPLVPMSPDVASLLATERSIVPQPEAVRRRALLRARAADRWQGRGAGAQPVRVRNWLRRAPPAAAMVAAALVVSGLLAAIVQKTWQTTDPGSAAGPREPELPSPPSSTVAKARPALEAVPEPIEAETRQTPRPIGSTRLSSREASSASELLLLQAARRAIAAGDFASALASVDAHARRFPGGRLGEEREALRIRALQGLGRSSDARRAASDFRRQFPRSVLSPQMDAPP